MSRKSKIRCGGLIFRTLAGFMFIAFSFALSSNSFAQEGKWTTKADMPTARYGLSTSVVNGKIYAIGGREGMQTFSTVEEYDPATDTWTRKADMPTARNSLSTSVVNGKIYAISGVAGGTIGPVDVVEEYDPATDTWRRRADMPATRRQFSTSVVNGKIYAIGGSHQWHALNDYTGLSTVEEYDPVTNKWAKKADMPTARYFLSTSVVKGKISVIGGGTSGTGPYFPTVE